jgi:phosphoribosylformylglycinamidine synthase subunit PurL
VKRTRGHARENDRGARGLPRRPAVPVPSVRAARFSLGAGNARARTKIPSRPEVRVQHLTQVVEQPLHRSLGLTDGEFERICVLLERTPNDFELAVFSLLWSEHCGYKHSAPLLRRLPSAGDGVLQGPGENAGVVDLGEGEAVAFKVESHNHPSAVEPFQGAATGVGGILRDIVAMGARPIALLDGLWFGDPGHAFRRAVAGIGAYGNSVGVPTVGGETVFDEAYRDNCLVNAMCVGILDTDRLTRASGGAPGHLIVLFGATTGRDGIGGASVLASQELGDDDPDKRPSVQIGDPFTGKKLIEASVELAERGLVESLQDCGAAGLASALAEMADDRVGIDVHLDRVPLREPDLEPWEIMISESQERMVAVVRPQMAATAREVCDRWELEFAVIGEVTDSGELCAFHGDEPVGSIPARFLTDECPRYEVERKPRALKPRPPQPVPLLERLWSSNGGSRRWVYEQYDQLVGSRTVRRPGLDAAVLRLRPSHRGLAVSLDAPPPGTADPWAAGAMATLEAARNVACAGGRPLALTDCLNFGNPEKAEIGWELAEAIEGIAQAAAALGIPVVSGNVSLYNETDGRAIPPTPVVGCVGLVPDVRDVPGRWREGDVVLLAAAPAPLELAAEAALVRFLWKAAPLLTLAHDVDEGGVDAALVEAALSSGVGADVVVPYGVHEAGQAVIACAPEDVPRLGSKGLRRLGVVGGERICGYALDELQAAWEPMA